MERTNENSISSESVRPYKVKVRIDQIYLSAKKFSSLTLKISF
jgi:hypothetical protein